MNRKYQRNNTKSQLEIKQWILENNILDKLKNDLSKYENREFEVGWSNKIELVEEESSILDRGEIDWLKS